MMVFEPEHAPQQAFGGPSFVNPRRRQGIIYSADSAEARWAAEVALRTYREQATKVDADAEIGAEILRMMRVMHIPKSPNRQNVGGLASGGGGEANYSQQSGSGLH